MPTASATRRLGAKPAPSALLRRIEKRFDHEAPTADSGDRKQHFAVARSVDKTPGLAELIAMGFKEEQARRALRQHDGNLDRALESLL